MSSNSPFWGRLASSCGAVGAVVAVGCTSCLAVNYIYFHWRKSLTQVSVSAPGKALIAGGYLVLEKPNIGVTVSCSSRFHTTVGVLDLKSKRKHILSYDFVMCLFDRTGNWLNDLHLKIPSRWLSYQKDENSILVIVDSPQFKCDFVYRYHYNENLLTQISGDTNEFVEKCLEMVFSFVKRKLTTSTFLSKMKLLEAYGGLGIRLRADNDFYSQVKYLQSQNIPLLSRNLAKVEQFKEMDVDANTGNIIVNKTGMGSSAALVTSLVGALCQYFEVVSLEGAGGSEEFGLYCRFSNKIISHEDLPISINRYMPGLFRGEYWPGYQASTESQEDSRRIVHNLAQTAHAIAQGKVGSGFDVAAAVYGTQLYERFDPAVLKKVLDSPAESQSDAVYNAVLDEEAWTQSISPLTLPTNLNIVMGDVCGGSSSTSMAKKVLAWKKEGSADAMRLWSSQQATNANIAEKMTALQSLQAENGEAYSATMKELCRMGGDAWKDSTIGNNEIRKAMIELRSQFQLMRNNLKAIGVGSGVDIEPDAQTKLIDATEKIEGVLCAGVPGAGGEDAIFAITLSATSRDAVEALWSTWHLNNATTVCPLVLSAEFDATKSGIRRTPLQWNNLENELEDLNVKSRDVMIDFNTLNGSVMFLITLYLVLYNKNYRLV